jgi:hypothetical protein
MSGRRREYPRTSRARLRVVVLVTGVVLVITAAVVTAYRILGEGNSGYTNAQVSPTLRPQPTATLRPSSTTTRGSTASCSGARDTPGGPDPWGGCWPGPNNTGPQAGTPLTSYTGKVLPDHACMITTNTIITAKRLSCQIIVNSGHLTLEDSSLSGEVYNYGAGSVLIKNTTINGGSDHTETVLGSNITIEDSNLYGNQHEVYCGDNCTVEDSWLHDNHNFGSADHENSFLSTGGDHYNLQHNSVYCVGGCTGDITFLGSDSEAVVNRNLLVASRYAAYCLYPYSGGGPSIVNQMAITNNVFQRGTNGKCAYYGPVYGWDTPNSKPGTSGYRNVWSGNIWNDGTVLAAP